MSEFNELELLVLDFPHGTRIDCGILPHVPAPEVSELKVVCDGESDPLGSEVIQKL